MPALSCLAALVAGLTVLTGVGPSLATAQPDQPVPATSAADAAVRSVTDGFPISTRGFGAERPADASSAPPRGVADDVYTALADRERAPVVIRLTEQADPETLVDEGDAAAAQALRRDSRSDRSPAAVEAADDARALAVVELLKDVAHGSSRQRVRDLLTTHHAAEVTAYWIFNGLAATVDEATVEALAGHPDIASVTLDETIRLPEPQLEPTEPQLPSWSLEKVAAPKVWGEYGDRGQGIVVGIMDSGADGGHPALKDSWRGVTGDPAKSWFAATGEDYPLPGDGFGHGTHVTGSIVGRPPGEITGVAPQAQWIAAKIFRDSGASAPSIIHAGFQWMLAPGGDPTAAPDVVNNSWGSDDGSQVEYWDDVNAWLAAGIVPMFANGNAGPAGNTVGSPASFPQSIGIGATDSEDFVAYFSSRGPVLWDGVEYVKPLVSAPGDEIRSTWPRQLESEGYATISGTSMATPHVTGVVSLMLSARPDLTVNQVRAALAETARVEPHMGATPNSRYGTGIVDAYAAVTDVAHSGTLSGTVTSEGAPVAATIRVAGRSVTSDAANGHYEIRVAEGAHEVTIASYGLRTERREITVATGEQTTLDVTLDPAALHTLSGVVTVGGDPVPDARVAVAGTPLDPAFTDAGGRFAIEVPEGSYELRASAAGYRQSRDPVDVTGDTEVIVELSPIGQTSDVGWRQFQNNATRSGLAGEPLVADTLVEDWTADAGSAVTFAAPVLDGERAYIGLDSGQLLALDLNTGDRVWAYDTGATLRGTPAVTEGLVVSGGGVDGGIYAIDAETGEPGWIIGTPDRRTVYSAPVVRAGVVYVATGPTTDRSDTVLALDAATGDQLWAADVGSAVFGGLAVTNDLVVVGNAGEGQLIGLDTATGERRWTLQRDDDYFIGGPSIVGGTIYVATTDDVGGGSLLAVDAGTGRLVWQNAGHGDGQGTTPAVYGDLVIAGSHSKGFLAAYDRSTGQTVWRFDVDGAVSVSGMVANDGYVVAGSQLDNRFFALDAATGKLVWETEVGANVTSSAAYADGRLVTADIRGTIRAFHPVGTITGTVTGPDGPVAADIRVVESDTDVAVGDDGRFELAHRPGDFTLEVRAYGLRQRTLDITIVAGRTRHLDVRLEPADDGAVAGRVTDASGSPLEGVAVTLEGAPVDAESTDSDGRFAFDVVAEGGYDLAAELAGYVPRTESIDVQAGQTTTVDLTLEKYNVAVVGDYEHRIAAELTDLGYTVRESTYAEVTERPGDYAVVVANGAQDDPGANAFQAFLDATDQAGTSVVWLDQWSLGWGAINHLTKHVGDPAEIIDSSSSSGRVSLVPRLEHPLVAGLPLNQRTQILVPNDWSAFTGYSGLTVADLETDDDGVAGAGLAFKPRGMDSTHVLVGSLAAAASWGIPGQHWTSAARTVLDNAVGYAETVSYGRVTGTVTDGSGQPLAARVTVLESGQQTTAAGEGYRLLLDPGTYTLRVEQPGYVPVEQTVTVTGGESVVEDVLLSDAGAGAVRGVVTSGTSGDPVGGATVTVAGHTSMTADDGSYAIVDVPGGDHELGVSAAGYLSSRTSVVVTAGQETVADVSLARAPRVGVLGDHARDGVIPMLRAGELVAEPIGWSDLDHVADYDVVVFNDPADPGRQTFADFLQAMDDAEVSGVFPDDEFSAVGGAWLLRKHLGDPAGTTSVDDEGIVRFRAIDAGHPLFAGLGESPEVLRAGRGFGAIEGYQGIPLAEIVTEGSSTGVAAAYRGRTPGSVHVLLSGLAASLFQSPNDDWTSDGKRLYRNAVSWAADPGLGGVEGIVTGADGQPVTATIGESDTAVQLTAGADGNYVLPLAPGARSVEFAYFGHETVTHEVEVTDGVVSQLDVALPAATDAVVAGQVTADGTPVADAAVSLLGSPLRATTDADGRYRFTHVEARSYELDIVADGYVRSRTSVSVDGSVESDVELRPSPRVGVITDYQNRLSGYLDYWGYQPQPVTWSDVGALPDLDLVVANLAISSDPDSSDGYTAFVDAVNRAGVSVLWLDQFARGSFQYLQRYEGDPVGLGEGRAHGAVTVHVEDPEHPLLTGLPESFGLVADDSEYSWFEDFSGQTVATVESAAGEGGGLVGVRARGAQAVDVLLGTLSVSTYGYPAYGDVASRTWSPEAERLLRNALAYALDPPALGGEVRGTVSDVAGSPRGGTVTVVESGRSLPVWVEDGSFVVPLAPGDWTLRIRSFGYEDAEVQVSVAAGEVVTQQVTLTRQPIGRVAGVVTSFADAPVDGATVTVLGTDLGTTTGPDGTYHIDDIPAGDWTLRFAAAQLQAERHDVTIRGDQTTTLDVQLAASRQIAVVGDYVNSLRDLLSGEGYGVTSYSYAQLDALVGDLDTLDLVIFNGTVSSSQRPAFGAAVDAVEESGTSMIFGGQWGGYAIGALSEVRGDPSEIDYDFVPDGIDYVPTTEHPIFAGFVAGEPIELVDEEDGNQQWLAFTGYSGSTIAQVAARDGEVLGDAVGYRFTSPTSVEILLGGLSASSYGRPGADWTADGELVYLNAVAWAVDAHAATVSGAVTGAGGPVAGATVRAVETGVEATTAGDGTYALTLPGGTHTVELTADGFETATREVVVAEGEHVTLDVDLVPLPRGGLTGVVTSSDGEPVAGATVTGAGPEDWTATTGETGVYAADGVLSGDYQVTVTADGYLPASATVTVPVDGSATLDVTLRLVDVAVLGDVDRRLTSYLRDHDVAAGDLPWSADLDVTPYDVIVVNGGHPSKAAFDAVLTAADQHEVGLIFSGSWGVDVGGVRLLEEHTGRVAVTDQGYGDGPVTLTGFDADHPLFAGLADPATLIGDGGYYSVLGGYVGARLADVAVERFGGSDAGGLGVGYSWRTAGSVELVLSTSAVTDAVGPGLGWTPDGGRLLRNAIDFARDAELASPVTPTVEVPAPGVTLSETETVTGTASWPSEVTLSRRGAPVDAVAVNPDGTWSAKVPLAVGANQLTARATNLVGSSPMSEAVTLWRWRPVWKVSRDGRARSVLLRFQGPPPFPEPADAVTLMVRDEDGTVVRRVPMRWVVAGYLSVLRRLPPGSHALAAEIVIDGVTLEADGPTLDP